MISLVLAFIRALDTYLGVVESMRVTRAFVVAELVKI
jgi:hypothetical protein